MGVGDTKRRDVPTEVENLKGHVVIGAACGRNHTLFLTSRGLVFAAGDNKSGQCGVGKNDASILSATRVKYTGPPIVRVGAGAEFSMILDVKGPNSTSSLNKFLLEIYKLKFCKRTLYKTDGVWVSSNFSRTSLWAEGSEM